MVNNMKKVLLLILLTSINLMAAEYTLDELLKSAVVNSGFSNRVIITPEYQKRKFLT